MNFIPEWSIILQFAIATFVLSITPGPDMTLFVGRALSEGKAAGFACLAGASSGIVVHTTMVAIGLSALIVASPSAFFALKIVGAGYLVWLAYQAIRHGSAFSPEKQVGQSHTLFQNWLTGFGINLLNPKIILFFMTFLPQFVSPGDPDAAGQLIALGMLFIVISLPVVIGLVLAADRVAALLRGLPRIARAIDWLFASVFAGFAAQILFSRAR